MASAQVLPASTRKQKDLEAGKRKLEEFRKKKAAERAKKGSSNQTNVFEVSSNEKKAVETELVRATVSDGAGTSDGPSGGFTETSSVISSNDGKAIDFFHKKEQTLPDNAHSSLSTNGYNSFPADEESKRYGVTAFPGQSDVSNSYYTKGMNNDIAKDTGTSGMVPYGSPPSDQSIALRPQASQDFETSTSQSSLYGSPSTEHKLSLRDSTSSGLSSSHLSVAKVSPQNSVSTFLQNYASNGSTVAGVPSSSSSLYEDLMEPSTSARGSAQEVGKSMNGDSENFSDLVTSRFGEAKYGSSAIGFSSLHNSQVQISESTGFKYDARGSSNYVSPESVTPDTNSRRSRPSFLDSLNVPRASSGTLLQQTEPENSFISDNSKSNGMSFLGSLPFHKPSMDDGPVRPFPMLETVAPHSAGGDQQRPLFESSLDNKHEFYSSKQNDDFAALEQHIEDLTQEKFSLQRALDASRVLAESLASENSSLTESYNQQRSVVDQLKSDMEGLQEEIRAHQVELQAMRNEYGNAQLECSAADERAKLLASEVIGLEEKALRLRSSELKLERQLENSQAEISSYKKKLSSLEKDRSDLHSTINALQEEKKLLQSMLRKASTNERKADVSKNTTNKKDVFTSTEDLENEEAISNTTSLDVRDASSFPLLPENGESTFDLSSVNIPPDQMRTIENINTLVSELALEKEELIQSLASESSHCSKLKELNNELSRKLEAQTQRLELLTAQSMANESIQVRQPNSRDVSHDMADITPYADEGDEVVERVLGWIMKLFPGGPSKRRTSKLL